MLLIAKSTRPGESSLCSYFDLDSGSTGMAGVPVKSRPPWVEIVLVISIQLVVYIQDCACPVAKSRQQEITNTRLCGGGLGNIGW